ncbi:hypothetical protein MTO96_003952 [Rhipicephalus appendiculatus]
MTSEDLSEMASSSSESEETDAADSATPESFPEEPLPAYEFQQAPTGGQSGSYHTDISKLSSGQQSGYDGSFPSAYSSAAAVASTNVVTGSPHNVSAQKLCADTSSPQEPQVEALRIVVSRNGYFRTRINTIQLHRMLPKISIPSTQLSRSMTESHRQSLIMFRQKAREARFTDWLLEKMQSFVNSPDDNDQMNPPETLNPDRTDNRRHQRAANIEEVSPNAHVQPMVAQSEQPRPEDVAVRGAVKAKRNRRRNEIPRLTRQSRSPATATGEAHFLRAIRNLDDFEEEHRLRDLGDRTSEPQSQMRSGPIRILQRPPHSPRTSRFVSKSHEKREPGN